MPRLPAEYEKTRRKQVHLDADTENWLDRMAEEQHISRSSVLRELIAKEAERRRWTAKGACDANPND